MQKTQLESFFSLWLCEVIVQFSITFHAVFFTLSMFIVVRFQRILTTFSTCYHLIDSYKTRTDFLILMLPKTVIIMPMITTAPNSPLTDDGMAFPCNTKIIPTPIITNAPPTMIKIPTALDGSFLVMKNDVMSMMAGITPNITPLVLTSVWRKAVF